MSDTEFQPAAPEQAPLTEAELRDIIDDPTMTLSEKQLLLERYARSVGAGSGTEASLEPLEAQIAEAITLLGAGGHRAG